MAILAVQTIFADVLKAQHIGISPNMLVQHVFRNETALEKWLLADRRKHSTEKAEMASLEASDPMDSQNEEYNWL